MHKILLALAVLVLGLAGCAWGIKPGQSPSATFRAPVSYQDAYRSAVDQARLCLRGKEVYEVKSQLDGLSKSAMVRVVAPFTAHDLARVDIKAINDKASNIQVTMWGVSIWNDDALDAMQDAILYDIASCTAYMPRSHVRDARH